MYRSFPNLRFENVSVDLNYIAQVCVLLEKQIEERFILSGANIIATNINLDATRGIQVYIRHVSQQAEDEAIC
jgi:hypothetical protein